jgi:hypothetical protein
VVLSRVADMADSVDSADTNLACGFWRMGLGGEWDACGLTLLTLRTLFGLGSEGGWLANWRADTADTADTI